MSQGLIGAISRTDSSHLAPSASSRTSAKRKGVGLIALIDCELIGHLIDLSCHLCDIEVQLSWTA